MNGRTDNLAMTHLDDGTLRAYLDRDPSLSDGTRTQIALALVTDAALAARVADLHAQTDAVGRAFAPLAAPPLSTVEVERAYRRLQTRLTVERPTTFLDNVKETVTTMKTANPTRMRRYAFAGSAAALALVLVLLFAPVGSVVSAALDKFRYHPEKFAVITLNTKDFPQFAPNGTKPAGVGAATKPEGTETPAQQQAAMQEISKYVQVTSSIGQGTLPGYPVKDAAEAQAKSGRTLNAPTNLPDKLVNAPKYYVSDKQTADANLNLKEIRPLLTQAGQGNLLPATGDSATVHVDVPTASIISYGLDPTAMGAAAKNQKGLVVAAIGVPTIDVQGLDVQAIANTITAMPGFPPALAQQLKAADLQHTIILPVTDQQNVTNGTMFNNAPSTLISQKDGSGAVAMFIKNDTLYIVAGTYDGATIQKVAQSVKA